MHDIPKILLERRVEEILLQGGRVHKVNIVIPLNLLH